MVVSEVTKRGTFTLTFSEAMDLDLFLNKTWNTNSTNTTNTTIESFRKLRVSHGGVAGTGGRSWYGT
jgi:hypothetical protein